LYFAHNANASSVDLFRVRVVGENGVAQTVWARPGSASNVSDTWATRTASLDAWAGQTIQIRIEALDDGSGSIIEAGVDNLAITVH
jgi:aminopeptidase S